MLSYAQVQGKTRILQSLTGLNESEFEHLRVSFQRAWQTYLEEEFITVPGRARAYGAGRPPRLERIEDKLLFILMYFRMYPTQEVQGFLFGLGQPQAHEWIHKLTRILNQALGKEQQLPERDPARLEDVLRACPSLQFMIDGTERRINRPQDPAAQKEYYSGKKKAHTVKNDIISERGGKVIDLSDTFEGKKHDQAIADAEDYCFPEGSQLWQDTGFQGYAPAGTTIFQPKKKPKGQELSEVEKARNREISKDRIEIEHQIGGIKRCNIVVHKFRNRTDHYVDDVMETACGLHNFRLSHRKLAAA